jgi:hypothetical protein
MRVLQLFKIPYTALPYLLLRPKILKKTTLLPKIHHPLEHHSCHTTPPQNSPTEQAHHQCSPPHINFLKSAHATPPLQNPPIEQAPQQHYPPHIHSLKSPHTTPPL